VFKTPPNLNAYPLCFKMSFPYLPVGHLSNRDICLDGGFNSSGNIEEDSHLLREETCETESRELGFDLTRAELA
jgi:hypothetical protein